MKNKNFIIIVIGQIISLFGNAIQRFSMSLYLLEFTGSTAAFANILAISTIPYVLFAPIAGMLSDKVNRKKIMVYLDLFCAILIGSYAFILVSGRDNQFIVGTVMFMLSICFTLYGPAVTASIPQVVEEEKLTSANGIINQVGSIVNFAGPIIAGVVYGIFGIKAIVIVNAVSFLFAAIMELFLDIPDVKREEVNVNIDSNDKIDRSKNTDSSKGDMNETKEKVFSIRFIKDSFVDMYKTFKYLLKEKKVILSIIMSYALCNIFLVPILSIVAPYFINIYLGLSAEIYGLVEAICVLGMIIGGFLISVRPKMFSMKKVHYIYFPMLIGVILMIGLPLININKLSLAGFFALGGLGIMLSLAISNVLTLTFIQKEIPENILGKVSAFSVAIATISVAPGQLLYGQILESGISLSIIFLLTAIANVALIIFIKQKVSLA
ncbi:MFS transporter [Clostridium nigeriense]|uniref:MFS transporter n=1 Tax=Clostridium nigeriense TaxID=1805470 RepID=UPI0008366979|nr:MFS transporter [Clostridium nigeriense]